jgi:hypothetical protein
MRKALAGSLAAWITTTGLVLAQDATPPPPAPAAAPAPPFLSPDRIASPVPDIVTSPHPWDPKVVDGDRWPYINEPWRQADRRLVPEGQFWISADYLLWGIKGDRLPPLVSAGPVGSAVLFGGTKEDVGPFSGGRFTAGVWVDEDHAAGFEGSYFGLAERSADFSATSAGGAPLALLFVNALTGGENTLPVAGPGRSGGVSAFTSTRLQGAEATCVGVLAEDGFYRVEFLAGFRYLELTDTLNSTAVFTVPVTVHRFGGDGVTLVDEFDTRNHFYGGQAGVRGEYHLGDFVLGGSFKLGLGDNVEHVVIGGSTTLVRPRTRGRLVGRFPTRGPASTTTSGGLLTQPSNIGEFNNDEFAAVPELAVAVGYQINDHVRVFVGYDFLFWSDVVRAGDQIDPFVNPNRVRALFPAGHPVGADRPAFSFHQTDIWAQGGTFGIEINY